MNRLALSILTFLALSPIATVAQASAAQTAAPVLYAEAEAPAAFSASVASSSSSSSDYDYAAPSAASAAGAASAADANASGGVRPFSALGVGFKFGIGGIGFDVATPLLRRLNVRGGAGFFSYNYSGTIDNDPVAATLKLNNAEVMLDLFPFNGSFRLSAGTTVYNTTGLSGTVNVAGGTQITVGNTSYTSNPANPVTGTVSAGFGGKAVPRFTLGWGNMAPRHGHVRFETELGVEVIGTPTVGWTYGGTACRNPSNGSTCTSGYGPIASADITAQNASLQSDLNGLKVFPIMSIGLSYKIGASH